MQCEKCVNIQKDPNTGMLICLTCGENVAVQIDLNKLSISTDCKNEHHFRHIPFNIYYNFLL